ncbi:MAG: 23S rRNA (adenine(2503)-C(2))-methyltransferase RlmN [Planctomycetota bacterium]|nr:MAG: 23S rRNA (adenine(2503)-C(2))-methyltransferase RlmN [Planctomycetota bacterium]
MSKDLKNLTFQQVRQLVAEFGGRKFLAKYLFSFIHAHHARQIDEITPLPKDLRRRLTGQGYFISQLETVETLVDPDGTVKFLFAAADGVRLESVLLTDAGEKQRKTLCISCQAGCRMACALCATGRGGFQRNLTAAEIADQVYQAARCAEKINNIVYMGMGEPFDNYDEVIRSARILNHHAGANIGQRHITISTCGIPHIIERFADEALQVRLAVSLHAAGDRKRRRIMPVAAKYPLAELISAIKTYQQKTARRVSFEYCMIKNLNDSPADARALIGLIKGINAAINLIEYNPHEGCTFAAAARPTIRNFKDILMQAGVETIIRHKRGRKINAACGQLTATLLHPQSPNHT